MNKKINEAEELDIFLDDLVRDSNAVPPTHEELNSETIRLLRQVVLAEQGPAQDESGEAEIRARVWQQVLSNAQAASRSESRASSRKSRPPLFSLKRWQRAALAATFVLAAVAVGIYALASRPTPVSAQEVIEKAYAAASLPSNGAVQSFFMTEVGRAVPTNARLNALSGLRGDEQILSESKRWYQAPNRWRSEFRQVVRSVDGQEIPQYSSIQISDGTNFWYYDPGQNTVMVEQFDPTINGKGGFALFGENVSVLEDLLQQAAACYEPKVTGRGSVAGRVTHVIDLGATKCPSASDPEMNGRLLLWVDQETFFILKLELYDLEDSQVIMTREATQVQYNIALDPALFTFTPPAGADITDNRPQPAPGEDEYQGQLEQLAQQVDFPLFVPGYLPQGLAPRQPRLNPVEQNTVELAYVPPEEVGQDTLAAGNGILIQQQKATHSLVARWTEGANPVEIAGGTGWLRQGIRNADGSGTDSAALVLRDGTLVSISSFTISPDELVRVAAGLKPAPGSHAPLPNPTPPTLKEIRGRVSFPVFIPTYLPEGLAPGMISGGELPAENVEIKYLYRDGTVGLLVLNGHLGCCPGSLQVQSEAVILPNGITAHLVRSPMTIYGGMTLWWEQDGTHIDISGPNLAEVELVNIAASMSSTADLGGFEERTPLVNPTEPTELSFDPLLPTWLPEEATRSIQVDGDMVTIGYDPHPQDAPHSVLTLVEMPASIIVPGGSPDPEASVEQVGGAEVTVIRRGEHCITYEWTVGDLYLQLTNPYDPPGQPRYSCDQLRRIVESIQR